MNSKGQSDNTGFGFVVMAAVMILIGLAFYSGSVAPSIGQMTQLSTSINKTFTLPANGATSELTMCGQEVRSIIVSNATGQDVIPATNYTTSSTPGTDGYLAAKITTTTSLMATKSVNVSCNYEPKGYVDDAGSRGIVVLIGIFCALLILICALPDVRQKFFDFIRG